MMEYVAQIKKVIGFPVILLTIVTISLSGCVKDPKSNFEDCLKEESKVNPNYYNAQLNCQSRTGYSP
jgi:hypothetical protein